MKWIYRYMTGQMEKSQYQHPSRTASAKLRERSQGTISDFRCGGGRIYLRDYADGREVGRGLSRWFKEYGELRPHQPLGNACPAEVYLDPAAHGARQNRR